MKFDSLAYAGVTDFVEFQNLNVTLITRFQRMLHPIQIFKCKYVIKKNVFELRKTFRKSYLYRYRQIRL